MKFRILLYLMFLTISNLCAGFSINRDTLSNGFVILTSEAHKLPMVEVKVVIKAGSIYDPAGKEGLANLTAKMLLRGTKSHTGDELLEKIESLGALLDINCQEDFAQLSARSLSKDLTELLEIIAECIQEPAFKSAELKRLKNQVYSEILSQLDDPFYAGQVAFRKLLFKNHPLNHDPFGFDTTINNIEIDDAKKFYDSYYGPNNAFIILVGDFNHDSIMPMIDKLFGGWKRKELSEFQFTVPETITKEGIIVKRRISQSYVFLGFFGPDIKAPDWMPARIMNYILGGSGLTSRLANEIREKRGLAYSVYSFFDRFRYGGYFVVGVQTKSESTNEVIDIILKEIKQLPESIKEEELSRAKKYYIGNFPLNFDTYQEITNFISRIEFEELGLDYAERFEDYISRIELQDVIDAAKKYLHPDNFCLAIVGDIDETAVKIEDIEWVK